jgi:hypothetical protein
MRITYPVTSSLGDIFTDFLGGETQGTDLGGQRGGGTYFTTSCTEATAEKKKRPQLLASSFLRGTI